MTWGLATAFEDFHLNNFENLKKLIVSGEVVGETHEVLNILAKVLVVRHRIIMMVRLVKIRIIFVRVRLGFYSKILYQRFCYPVPTLQSFFS